MQTLPAQGTETDQRLIKFLDAIAKGFSFLLQRLDLRRTLPAQAIETDQRLIKFPDAIAKGFFLPFKALRPHANLAGTTD